jgi:hypothetical protein
VRIDPVHLGQNFVALAKRNHMLGRFAARSFFGFQDALLGMLALALKPLIVALLFGRQWPDHACLYHAQVIRAYAIAKSDVAPRVATDAMDAINLSKLAAARWSN